MTCTRDGSLHIGFQTAARIHPAPLARPFSKGLLSGGEFRNPNPCLQGSGVCCPLIVCERGGAGFTGSRGSKGGGAFRHPERRKTSYVKETLIQSQNQISYGFLYIVSSTFSLNSSLFASNVSSLCIKIQE